MNGTRNIPISINLSCNDFWMCRYDGMSPSYLNCKLANLVFNKVRSVAVAGGNGNRIIPAAWCREGNLFLIPMRVSKEETNECGRLVMINRTLFKCWIIKQGGRRIKREGNLCRVEPAPESDGCEDEHKFQLLNYYFRQKNNGFEIEYQRNWGLKLEYLIYWM